MTRPQALGYSKILIPNHILTFIADSLKTAPVSLDKRRLIGCLAVPPWRKFAFHLVEDSVQRCQ